MKSDDISMSYNFVPVNLTFCTQISKDFNYLYLKFFTVIN